MVATCQNEDDHATAFGKSSIGTRLGVSACPAGPLKARATPKAMMTP